MSKIFLLGAGASFPARLPGAFEISRSIYDKLASKNYPFINIIRYIMGGLVFNNTINGSSPFAKIDIEEFINTIDMLANQETSTLNPYISSWQPSLTKLISASNKKAKDLFVTIHDDVHDELRDNYYIQKYSPQLNYLRPLISESFQNNSCIATLNYDNSLEILATTLNISVNTGINDWKTFGEIKRIPGKLFLLKLHGSITWQQEYLIKQPNDKLPQITFSEIQNNIPADYSPAIIFGGPNKLTAQGPFLSLFRSFENELAQSTELFIIGYSLRDSHINELISNWFNRSTNNNIYIIDPNFDTSRVQFATEIKALHSKRIHWLIKNTLNKKKGVGAKEGISFIFNSSLNYEWKTQ